MTKYFVAVIRLFSDYEETSEESLKDRIESVMNTNAFRFPDVVGAWVKVTHVTLEEYTKEGKNGKI